MKPYYQDSHVTIYHGDCREALPQLDVKVDLVLTDPPYGTGVDNNDTPVSNEIWQDIRRCMSNEAIAMIMGYAACLFEWAQHFSQLKLIGYIVWYKPNEVLVSPGLTRVHQDIAIWGHSVSQLRADIVREPYRMDTDPSLLKFFGKGTDGLGGRLAGTMKSAEGRRCTDLWEINVPFAHFNSQYRLHPHQKPDELVNRLILLGTEDGNLILDPFFGSGTTAWCAKKLNRRCIGYEIEEKYCEIAANRCRQMVMEL